MDSKWVVALSGGEEIIILLIIISIVRNDKNSSSQIKWDTPYNHPDCRSLRFMCLDAVLIDNLTLQLLQIIPTKSLHVMKDMFSAILLDIVERKSMDNSFLFRFKRLLLPT